MLPNQDTEYTILKSLGDAYLQVAQGQLDAVAADDKNRWSLEEKDHTGMHGEEYIPEIYKGKHGQSETEYQDSRSDAGKLISGDSKGSGANYSYKAKNTGPNPAGGSKKPEGQARMNTKDRSYLAHRKSLAAKNESYRGMTIGEILSEEEEKITRLKPTTKRTGQGLQPGDGQGGNTRHVNAGGQGFHGKVYGAGAGKKAKNNPAADDKRMKAHADQAKDDRRAAARERREG